MGLGSLVCLSTSAISDLSSEEGQEGPSSIHPVNPGLGQESVLFDAAEPEHLLSGPSTSSARLSVSETGRGSTPDSLQPTCVEIEQNQPSWFDLLAKMLDFIL